MLLLCEKGIIDKTRYEIKSGNHIFEVDEFYGNNEGLIIAEIELESTNESFEKPSWLGEVDDLSNWTWNNSFSYTLWKKIGVGFDFGLRSNKQEALNFALNQNPATATSFDDVDNDLQTYWTFGSVSYTHLTLPTILLV